LAQDKQLCFAERPRAALCGVDVFPLIRDFCEAAIKDTNAAIQVLFFDI